MLRRHGALLCMIERASDYFNENQMLLPSNLQVSNVNKSAVVGLQLHAQKVVKELGKLIWKYSNFVWHGSLWSWRARKLPASGSSKLVKESTSWRRWSWNSAMSLADGTQWTGAQTLIPRICRPDCLKEPSSEHLNDSLHAFKRFSISSSSKGWQTYR